MGKYLKYTSCNLLCLLTIMSLARGGPWLWLPLIFTLMLGLIGDRVLPEDEKFATYRHPWLLNMFLALNFPLLLVAYSLILWHISPYDFLGIGYWSQEILGWPAADFKQQTTAWNLFGGFLGLGLIFGIAGTNVAHELVHRTWSSWAQDLGRWFLAFTWDGSFAIEHVYGHHRKVATAEDPASARRGEHVFHFMLRSWWDGNRSAWALETGFLQRKNRPVFSWHNRLLQAWCYSLLLSGLAFVAAGWLGLVLQLVLAFYGKAYLELVNFVEHYGLVRVPQTPVHFRHSWNSNAPISSWMLYNLPRHSHHHKTGHLPFWRLQPQGSAPSLPFGYLTMILAALIPPLHRRIMAPALAVWDAQCASPEELSLLGRPN